MTTETLTDCPHDLDPRWCSLCRKAAGYRPGTDTFEGDCTVRAFVRLTGADYDEAAAILREHGFRPGKGTPHQRIVDALRSVGFNCQSGWTPWSAAADGGAFLVCGWKGRTSAHAWTIIDGVTVGAYRPPFHYEIWKVS